MLNTFKIYIIFLRLNFKKEDCFFTLKNEDYFVNFPYYELHYI